MYYAMKNGSLCHHANLCEPQASPSPRGTILILSWSIFSEERAGSEQKYLQLDIISCGFVDINSSMNSFT